MSSLNEKIAILAECYGDRQEFYREWYSRKTFAESVTGFARDIADRIDDAVEPAAVAAIRANSGFLEDFINPFVLSSAAKSFAGGFGGAASLISKMFLGVPDLLYQVASKKVGFAEIATATLCTLRQGNDLILEYAAGKAPKDPYERAFVASEVLGGPVMLLVGAHQAAGGVTGILRAAAGKPPTFFGPPPLAFSYAGGAVHSAQSIASVGSIALPLTHTFSGALLMVSSGKGGQNGKQGVSPLERYRFMTREKLIRHYKTHMRLAEKRGKTSNIINEITGGRKRYDKLSFEEKRAFVQTLAERSMEKEAIRIMAEWEFVEGMKAQVAAELAGKGMNLKASTGRASLPADIYGTIDDASLANLGDGFVQMLRDETSRLARMRNNPAHVNAAAIKLRQIMGEKRAVGDILKLSNAERLVSELWLRGFADDSHIMRILIDKHSEASAAFRGAGGG